MYCKFCGCEYPIFAYTVKRDTGNNPVEVEVPVNYCPNCGKKIEQQIRWEINKDDK